MRPSLLLVYALGWALCTALAPAAASPRLQSMYVRSLQVADVAVSADGRRLLVTGEGATRLLDAGTGRALLVVKGSACATFTPDGRQFALLEQEGRRVVLRDSGDGRARWTRAFHGLSEDVFTSINFSGDGAVLSVTEGMRQRTTLTLLSTSNGTPRAGPTSKSLFSFARFSTRGHRLVVGSESGVTVWDLVGERRLAQLAVPQYDEASALQLSPEGAALVWIGPTSGWSVDLGSGAKHPLDVAFVHSGAPPYRSNTIHIHSVEPRFVAWSPRGFLIQKGQDGIAGNVDYWSQLLSTAGRPLTPAIHQGRAGGADPPEGGSAPAPVAFADGFLVGYDRDLYFVSPKGRRSPAMHHGAHIYEVAAVPAAGVFLTADGKGAVRLWSAGGRVLDRPSFELSYQQPRGSIVVGDRTVVLLGNGTMRVLRVTDGGR